jgi:gluconolactonase
MPFSNIATPSRRAMLAGLAVAGLATKSARAADRAVVGHVERLDPALDALIDADAPVEKLMDGYSWAEGPVWVGGPDGYLLSSDVRGNVIRRWSEADGGSDWLRPGGFAGGTDPGLAEPGTNGLCLGRGGIVCADSGSRGVSVIDLKTKQKTMLCTHFEGKRFNSPNDVVLGPDGAIYFTDPPYGLTGRTASPLREMDYMGVFRIGTDNTVTAIDLTLDPNGIGLSPDGQTLYVTDKDKWLAITLDPRGRPTDKRVLVTASPAMRGGDGMRVDSAGNLWCSSKIGICIFAPDGKMLGVIHADDTESNCDFGADGHLYITSRSRLLRVKVKSRKLLWPVWRKTFG